MSLIPKFPPIKLRSKSSIKGPDQTADRPQCPVRLKSLERLLKAGKRLTARRQLR